jgi:hypothetical protein
MILAFDMQYPVVHSHTAVATSLSPLPLLASSSFRTAEPTPTPHNPTSSCSLGCQLGQRTPCHAAGQPIRARKQIRYLQRQQITAASNRSIAAGSRKPSKQPCKSDTGNSNAQWQAIRLLCTSPQ